MRTGTMQNGSLKCDGSSRAEAMGAARRRPVAEAALAAVVMGIAAMAGAGAGPALAQNSQFQRQYNDQNQSMQRELRDTQQRQMQQQELNTIRGQQMRQQLTPPPYVPPPAPTFRR